MKRNFNTCTNISRKNQRVKRILYGHRKSEGDSVSLIIYCLVGNSHEAYLSTSKVFRSNCPFVNLKPQINTADNGVVLLQTKNKTHNFFDDNCQRVCGSSKNLVGFCGEFCSFLLRTPKDDDSVLCII